MMNKIQQSKDARISSNPFPLWKEKPAGPEQRELERMFNSKEIDVLATPDGVRKKNELFNKFSASVFASHFRKTKARLGLCAVVPDGDAGSSSPIPELGGSLKCTAPQLFLPEHTERAPIEFRNSPFWTWTYTDHERKKDFVCVALPIISGSRSINFALSEDGLQVIIKYQWPTAMCIAAELFGQARNSAQKIPLEHPKVHAFVSHLLESDVTENSNPQGEIIINLPQKVQRDIGSWKKEAITIGETKIALLEFSAYQKTRHIEDADTSLVF